MYFAPIWVICPVVFGRTWNRLELREQFVIEIWTIVCDYNNTNCNHTDWNLANVNSLVSWTFQRVSWRQNKWPSSHTSLVASCSVENGLALDELPKQKSLNSSREVIYSHVLTGLLLMGTELDLKNSCVVKPSGSRLCTTSWLKAWHVNWSHCGSLWYHLVTYSGGCSFGLSKSLSSLTSREWTWTSI